MGDEDRLDPTELRLRDLEDALELDLERRLAGLELRLRAEPAGDEARLLMLLKDIHSAAAVPADVVYDTNNKMTHIESRLFDQDFSFILKNT